MNLHLLLYKPAGYISQFIRKERQRQNKKLLGDLYEFPEGTMAVGRLDERSEGLLLLTTDGMFSEKMRSKDVEKEYYVELDGTITDMAISQLREGVEISLGKGKIYLTLPCKVEKIDPPDFELSSMARDKRHGATSWVSIIICEGKYRQIRKMTASVGFPTLRLIRVRIGNYSLKKMRPGEVVIL